MGHHNIFAGFQLVAHVRSQGVDLYFVVSGDGAWGLASNPAYVSTTRGVCFSLAHQRGAGSRSSPPAHQPTNPPIHQSTSPPNRSMLLLRSTTYDSIPDRKEPYSQREKLQRLSWPRMMPVLRRIRSQCWSTTDLDAHPSGVLTELGFVSRLPSCHCFFRLMSLLVLQLSNNNPQI